MSTPAAPKTAAERAEARRQRILAKKSARMVYVSGAPSVKPSQAAEEEPVAPPPRAAAPQPAHLPPRCAPAIPELPRWACVAFVALIAVCVAWYNVAAERSSEAPVSGVVAFVQAEVALNFSGIVRAALLVWGLVGDGKNVGFLGRLLKVVTFLPGFVGAVRGIYNDAAVFGFLYIVAIRVARSFDV